MIEFGANLSILTGTGMNCLLLSAKFNFISFFVILYEEYSMDLSSFDSQKQTSLHICIEKGNFELACIIIAISKDLNIQDINGRTPLHLAVLKEKRKIVKLLLLNGANQYIKDNKGKLPIDLCEEDYSIVKLLVNAIQKKKFEFTWNWRFLVLAISVLTLKFLFFIWIFIKNKNKFEGFDYEYIFFGYGWFTLTIFLIIFNAFSHPTYESQTYTKLSVRLIQEIYSLYVPSFLCPYCICKKSKNSFHCMICKKCVKDYDHHCIWINNCIGKNNHFSFIIALVCFWVDFCYSIFLTSWFIRFHGNDDSIFALKFLFVFSSFLLVFVGPFFYLNISNFLNSTTVHEKFSFKTSSLLKPDQIGDPKSELLSENPLSVGDLVREFTSSESLSKAR